MGRQRSASVTGGPMVITTGAEETIAPAASVALATSVMVLPAAAPAFAATEKLDPTVGRVPEMLAGAATVPGPVAESESWVIAAPAVRDPPPCSVAGLSGEVIATWTAVMLIADEVRAAALMTVPALASVPVAPAVSVK